MVSAHLCCVVCLVGIVDLVWFGQLEQGTTLTEVQTAATSSASRSDHSGEQDRKDFYEMVI